MTAEYQASFYPKHLALLAVGKNVMPLAWWTPISKEPFRLLIAMDRRNHTLDLLRTYREAVLHLMPWRERNRVIHAGHTSGRAVNKAQTLGFHFEPAHRLQHTGIVDGAYSAFELTVLSEMDDPEADHVAFVFEVVAIHTAQHPRDGEPILFLGGRDYATLGKRWQFRGWDTAEPRGLGRF
jgi:flavin reductase (DIM6/NTAB) family NADH-FMN oxidoreductase RutF